MSLKPTRREAIVTIAAAAAIPRALRGADSPPYEPQTFSSRQMELLRELVDLIIPDSDTPGAAKAGVHEIIDYEAQSNKQLADVIAGGLRRVEEAGFPAMRESQRIALLEQYSRSQDARGQFFTALKNAAIDAYYSTETGLAQELGWKGNTYLPEFPGCQDEEHHRAG